MKFNICQYIYKQGYSFSDKKKCFITILSAIVTGMLLAPSVTALTAQPARLRPPDGVTKEEFQRAYQSAEGIEIVYRSIFEASRPSVVQITVVEQVSKNSSADVEDPILNDPFLRKFFGVPNGGNGTMQPQNRLGSGFIIDASGLIVTNSHVVGNATDVVVKFYNGESARGKVKGRDTMTDIALIQLKGRKDSVALPLGDSDKVKVGDLTIALGSPFGLDQTFTTGVVSAVGRGGIDRSGLKFIQTDASINQGNSGGPLINLKGEVIGINRMIYSNTGGSIGIGFAIPTNEIRNVINQIQLNGFVDRPFLGVQISDVPESVVKGTGIKGAFVSQVIPKSGADQAGLKMYDIIIAIEKQNVVNADELIHKVLTYKTGDTITIDYLREGKRNSVKVKLTRRPNE